MLIRTGYDIVLRLFNASPVIFLLRIHPSLHANLVVPEEFQIEPDLPVDYYLDSFGNRCGRLNAPPGSLHLRNHAVVWDSGEPDPLLLDAENEGVCHTPQSALTFLLPSRYCEVDSELMAFAWKKFGRIRPGWAQVQAICDFVHEHIRFDYQRARSNRTALEAFTERVGVCRDFTHLAITLCRCLNIPARYVTGYLGDIGVPPLPDPMDFSAWFEVHLGGGWYSFDARHNRPRIGRIVIARGRDAADVPITMVFANHHLEKFSVITEEIEMQEEHLAAMKDNINHSQVARSEALPMR
ncbi:MAG: transglutaminase family protein [Verrucomicrobia bacterium]|nr:transglutaminase family protein [Verrucomicrobiota bacterium]